VLLPLFEKPEECILFLDVFVCAQHRGVRPQSQTCPNATDVKKFKEVISSCERLVLYATPLTQPKALHRVWCLFELMSAFVLRKDVLMALSASDREMLKELLLHDFDRIVVLFTSIKSENAEATVAEDKDMIFEWIRRDLGDKGFKELNHLVASGMRLWLAETAKKLVNEETEECIKSTLMSRCGQLFVHLARFDEAEEMYRCELDFDLAEYGELHPYTSTTLNNLAMVLVDKGKLVEAELMLRHALTIKESSYGQDHPSTGSTLGNLAMTLSRSSNKDKLIEAEGMYRRSLEIDEAALVGKDDPSTGIKLNNLAVVLEDMGKMDEAEVMYRRALKIIEAALGHGHPSTGSALNNLAELLKAKDSLVEAEEMLRRSLLIDEVALGQGHPRTLIKLNNLAELLMASGKLDEAEDLLRRALMLEMSEEDISKWLSFWVAVGDDEFDEYMSRSRPSLSRGYLLNSVDIQKRQGKFIDRFNIGMAQAALENKALFQTYEEARRAADKETEAQRYSSSPVRLPWKSSEGALELEKTSRNRLHRGRQIDRIDNILVRQRSESLRSSLLRDANQTLKNLAMVLKASGKQLCPNEKEEGSEGVTEGSERRPHEAEDHLQSVARESQPSHPAALDLSVEPAGERWGLSAKKKKKKKKKGPSH
jgi:tetratricopeptide (TPR) repeat protein